MFCVFIANFDALSTDRKKKCVHGHRKCAAVFKNVAKDATVQCTMHKRHFLCKGGWMTSVVKDLRGNGAEITAANLERIVQSLFLFFTLFYIVCLSHNTESTWGIGTGIVQIQCPALIRQGLLWTTKTSGGGYLQISGSLCGDRGRQNREKSPQVLAPPISTAVKNYSR